MMHTITAIILKVLLVLYIAYALLKFFDFFFLSYETRIARIREAYLDGGRQIRLFDNVVLLLMLVLVALLVATSVEYLSFTTGLLVGMTIIQVYFHRFSDPLPSEKSPEPPVSAIKLMSYAIQASPGRAWRELVFMTALFVSVLFGLFV